MIIWVVRFTSGSDLTVNFGAGACEVKVGAAILAINSNLEFYWRAVVHVFNSFQRLSAGLGMHAFQQTANSKLGIFLNCVHIEL